MALVLAAGIALSGCANDPPKASFTLAPNPTQGQEITFDASASTPSHDANDQPRGPITRFEWDLDGNGSYETSTGSPQTTHRYTGSQTMNVSLRVTDAAGLQGSTSGTVVTDERETAMVPASDCSGYMSAWYGCGTAPVANPVASTTESPASIAQPNYAQDPVFDTYFGNFTSDAVSERADVTNGSGRVLVIHPEGGSDALTGFDANTRAQVFDKAITPRGQTRDIAFYRGSFYVLMGNGDVEVFDRDGSSQRVIRSIDSSALGQNAQISYSSMTVAWNELWTTASLGEKRGSALVVRDATTGALKYGYVHTADTTCRYGETGRVCSGENPALFFGQKEPDAPTSAVFHSGISAIPELGALVSQCRAVLRANDFGVTFAHDSQTAADAGPCVNQEFADALMGTESVWGQRHFAQVRKHADGWGSDSPTVSNVVDDYEVTARGAPNAWGTQPVDLTLRRSWSTADYATDAYQDVTYHARETQIDWWGPLTEQPGRWLKSPPNQCVNYVVSDADMYVVGKRGEHWWNPAAVSSVELWVGNADGSNYQRAASGTAANGQLCADTRNYASGQHDIGLRVALQSGAVLWRYAHFRKFDNAAPTGRLIAPEDLARGPMVYQGVADDANAGIASWRLQIQRPGGTTWEDVCTPDIDRDSDSRFECTWHTADGHYPDGTYQVRAAFVDAASDGGNAGYSQPFEVDVDNATFWDEVDTDPFDDPSDGPGNEPLETDTEPAAPDSSPPDSEPSAGDPDTPEPQCAAGDDYLSDIQPLYAPPADGVAVGLPDPRAALVAFLALPQLPGAPAALFQQVSQTADSVVYAASENSQIRAVVEIVRADDGSWIGSEFTACSQFPSATAPAAQTARSTLNGLP